MSVRIRGSAVSADAEVDALYKALRTTPRPIDYGTGGSFSLTSVSSTMAAGLSAASPIYNFRVNTTSLLAVVRAVEISAWSLGTGFAAGLARFDMTIARSWTVADTNGVIDTITTNNGKLRTSMASIAALSEIRHSDTATLTAGTRTLDNQIFRTKVANVTTAANTPFLPTATLFKAFPDEHPLVLTLNEGFVVLATVPATGTWTWAITTIWDEVASY